MRVSNTVPYYLSALAHAHAELSQFNDAWRCLDKAMSIIERTKERWFEAEVNRIAGEIALRSERDTTKAVGYFERALAVARQQQAKSWELRAAMSMARLGRGQGKQDAARDYPCGGAILGRIMVAIAVAVGAQAPFWRTKSMIC
jgi:predicted ATPase